MAISACAFDSALPKPGNKLKLPAEFVLLSNLFSKACQVCFLHNFYKPNQIVSPFSSSGSLPGNNKQHTADTKACQQHIHPDIRRQRVEEGEYSWIGAIGFVVEDADAQCHKRLGEVYDLLPHVGDGERGHSQVSHLVQNKNIKQGHRLR